MNNPTGDPRHPAEHASVATGTSSAFPAKVPRIIFGAARLTDSVEDRRLLDAAYEFGYRSFDTARIYGTGQSERCLGRWIRDRRLQSEVAVITKCCHPSHVSRLHRPELLKDIEASRATLGMDAIDVVLLHRDDPAVPVAELIDALNELVDLGKIRAFGVSNWPAVRIAEAQAYARSHSLREFCASSCQFSLALWTRSPWPGCLTVAGDLHKGERDWYLGTQFPLLAWSPLASGFSIHDGQIAADSCYCSLANLDRLRRTAILAADRRATVAQIGIAYVLSSGMNAFAVVSSSDIRHMEQNFRASDIRLSMDECRWLNLEREARA